ncbi:MULTISPECIES: ATP-binding protein [unclassified Streptomyces]|uniref:ATP-binding protein n=1 Tax=unclassified Streptomyces TaxID=2593676 RepID=UPI00090B00B9|nr:MULTISPECIES: ATP-binding protein [unclassified Streptomyces]MDX3245489.1 ATP-binding protein [Streptomyces sp. ME18-1-4]SHH81066.1 Anti-sigma regulatory factor (Ser/Thr protein kinase) [Streptomyces sp. 3214.6]
MERQAWGSGPTAIAGTSATRRTGEGTAEDVAEQDGASQLSRRLGRADLRAVPEARRALRELLRGWGRPGRSETAELLTSELVTNALVHTDDDAVLTATVSPSGLRVEVRDFVARHPRPSMPSPDEGTHGRGLVLVESLADTWGVRAQGGGKVVWFELGAEAA